MSEATIEPDLARAIITQVIEAAEGYEAPQHNFDWDSDADVVKEATELLKLALETSPSTVATRKIVALYESSLPTPATDHPVESDDILSAEGFMNIDALGTEALQYEKETFAAMQLAAARVRKTNIPVPPDTWEGEQPTLPRDITVISDVELRKLHGQYAALYEYAAWQTVLVEADKVAADACHSHYMNKAIEAVSSRAEAEGKKKTVAAIEAEASGDDRVEFWKREVIKQNMALRFMKAMRDMHSASGDRLSREWSMRNESKGSTYS